VRNKSPIASFNSLCLLGNVGHGVAQLVEALRYKPEGRGFESLEFFIDLILPAAL
jgi:hypothetical protein